MKDFDILRFSIRHSAVRFGCRAPPALAVHGQIENCWRPDKRCNCGGDGAPPSMGCGPDVPVFTKTGSHAVRGQ